MSHMHFKRSLQAKLVRLPFFSCAGQRWHRAVFRSVSLLLLALFFWSLSPLVSAQIATRRTSPPAPGPLSLKEFPLPEPHAGPVGLTGGPDGAIWFTEYFSSRIGRMTFAGAFTEFPLTELRRPSGITTGPDGNLWFTEEQGFIGRMTPTGTLTEFPLPAIQTTPTAITRGADGYLWFGTSAPPGLGRITLTGHISLYPLPLNDSFPTGLTRGPDGNTWFIEQYGRIGYITPRGQIREFVRPHIMSPAFGGIAAGPDGNLWFTQGGKENVSSLIGRISPQGTLTTFPLPSSSANPIGITLGPDGNLWFAELQTNQLGRITPQGVITEYALPEKTGGPDYMLSGSDGNLWFTSSIHNLIGRITPPRPTLART